MKTNDQTTKERPILFQGAMVRAILDGTKTQTRRICKSQPYSNGFGWNGHDISCHNDYLPPSAMLMDSKHGYTTSNMEGWEGECPYGLPGDHLWVRETWCRFSNDAPDGNGAQTYYRASQTDIAESERVMTRNGVRWKPSIHMPRAVSRILLEIVDVRAEQLAAISEADAIAEGVNPAPRLLGEDDLMVEVVVQKLNVSYPVARYVLLWDSINGKPGVCWEANPWVWVVEFKRVSA